MRQHRYTQLRSTIYDPRAGLLLAIESAAPFTACIDRLRERLRAPLPGTAAQLRMAPAYRMDPTLARVDGKECLEAGVLMLLFPLGGVPALVLTVRRGHLPNHPGQIAFPGAQREAGERLEETALREAHEEVNLDPYGVDVLGALTPLYIPPSGFCVYPFVGAVSAAPALRPTDAEVETILRVPLPHLLAPETLRREQRALRGMNVEVPFFGVDDHQVWGATAMMLAELLALFEDDGRRTANRS